jgi:outer membrane protein assembly factor BamB
MDRADGMQEVELAELAEPGAGSRSPDPARRPATAGATADTDDATDRRRRRRRAVLRWWPLGLLAVAAVVGSEVVLDARERARVAAAREHPGVVAYDVGADLRAHRSDPAALPSLDVVVGDLRVEPVEVVPGTPRAVRGVDVGSGDEVWRAELEDAARAAELGSLDPPGCWAAGSPAEQAVCFVQDTPTTEVEGGGYELAPPLRARLVRIDPRTGALTEDRELAPRSSVTATGDELVVAEVVGDGVRVAVEDAVSGEPRWSTDLPVDARALAGVADHSPGLQVTERHVLVHVSQQAWAVDRADGRVEVAGGQLWVGRGERLVSHGFDDGMTRLRGVDGSGEALAVGAPVWFDVDDGSVPGWDVLADTDGGNRRLRAVDARTGEQIWEHTLVGPSEGSLILLDDVLYGADGAAVWALDARDGTSIWRTPRDPEAGDVAGDASAGAWSAPVTDGRQLLLVEPEAPGDGSRAVLRAWSLASGALLWTAPLPEEAGGHAGVWDGALYGIWPDRVLLR